MTKKTPIAPVPEDSRFREIEKAIDDFKTELEIEDIIRIMQKTLLLEEKAIKVYLAAWAVWMSRNFKGRVIREDVASLLLKANEPLSSIEIAAALENLKESGLLQNDIRLEIRFSPAGTALARKLTAKREGL